MRKNLVVSMMMILHIHIQSSFSVVYPLQDISLLDFQHFFTLRQSHRCFVPFPHYRSFDKPIFLFSFSKCFYLFVCCVSDVSTFVCLPLLFRHFHQRIRLPYQLLFLRFHFEVWVCGTLLPNTRKRKTTSL